MKKSAALYVLLGAATLCGAEVSHRFIASGFTKGVATVIAADGSVEWQMDGLPWVQDCWKLESGNYLFSYKTGVKEVAPDKQLVWEYKSPAGVELHSVQPLENGTVLACECGTKRLIEIDRTGAIVKEIPLKSDAKLHHQFRTARKSKSGTYWLTYFDSAKAREVDSAGAVLRTLSTGNSHHQIHGLDLLDNGNVLLSSANKGGVKEFDPQGNLVWEITKADLIAAGVKKAGYAASVERLDNGNTLVSVYHGNPQFYEVTPDKKIVWKYNNPALGNVAGIRLLD